MAQVRQGVKWRRWLRLGLAALVVGTALVAFAWLAGWSFSPFPQIVGQNCGEASSGDIRLSDDPDQGEHCLWQAYTSCRAATLVFRFQYIDFGSVHAITVQPHGGACAFSDSVQGFSENFGGSKSSVTTYQCAGLQQQNGGLLLSACGKAGDVFLPPRPAEQAGTVCGRVENESRTVYAGAEAPPSSVADVEDCFWQAHAGCAQAATLIYTTDQPLGDSSTSFSDIAGVIWTHNVVTQRQAGSCVISDTVLVNGKVLKTYQCGSMARRSGGGLILRGCGMEGDLTIPPATPPLH